ncbi:MAG TPA: glycosyltransferase family 9 protein [Chthoniobacterales bacterium]
MKLVIFKVNQLGDNVVFLPVVQELRKRFPDWEIIVATSPAAADLYRGWIQDDRLLVHPTSEFNRSWKKPTKFLALATEVRKFKPDACLIPQDQANAAYGLALLSGARVRVGAKLPFIKLSFALTHCAQLVPDTKVPLQNWSMVKGLLEELAPNASWPAVPPPPDLSRLLSSDNDTEKCVVIHPGASRPYQRWPVDRMAALASRLLDSGVGVIWIDQPQAPAPSPQRNLVVRKTPNLSSLVSTINSACLFVGNNSGPMHIATALGVPSVIPCGPSHINWDPYWHGDRIRLLRHPSLPCLPCDTLFLARNVCTNATEPMACMNYWTVDRVFEEVQAWKKKWESSDTRTPL